MLVTDIPKIDAPYPLPFSGTMVADFECRSDGKLFSIYSPSHDVHVDASAETADAPYVGKETFKHMAFSLAQAIAQRN